MTKPLTYEVELRAILADDDAVQTFRNYCERHGSFIQTDRRFLVDYSTFLEGVEHRTRDIRARSTNGRREIIAKIGGLADASRQEAGLYVEEGSTLRQLLTLMAFLGFEKGVAAIRIIHRYELNGAEVALQEVRYFNRPDDVHSYFTEIEVMTDKAGQAVAESSIRTIYNAAGVEPVSNEGWYAYIRQLNREANGVFDFQTADWSVVERIDA